MLIPEKIQGLSVNEKKSKLDQVVNKPVQLVKPVTILAPQKKEIMKPEPVIIKPVLEVEKKNIVTENKNTMAWKPKTIMGKILKGAVIGGGSLLGLATGIGAVGGVIKGVGALKGASTGIGGLVKVADKLKDSAVNLVTGTTQAERDQVKTVKTTAKKELDKLEQVDRLIKAGATITEAKKMVGIADAELETYNGKPVMASSFADLFSNPVIKYGAIAVGLFAAAKFLKIVK